MNAQSVPRIDRIARAQPHDDLRASASATAVAANIALLGTGTVGRAVLARLDAWTGTPLGARLRLRYVANSRHRCVPHEHQRDTAGVVWREDTATTASLAHVLPALGTSDVRIVIDATASEAVADRHPTWLAQGVHVVTACKIGQGTALSRWRAIRDAQRIGSARYGEVRYGDSATVGAGLPVLSTIRALRAGGDCIHAIAGSLSGSLAWLFDRYDGMRPFSRFVREARVAGYTEPDPRDDLSGEDMRRKLLILARATGAELEQAAVAVAPLSTPELAEATPTTVDAALSTLDPLLRDAYAAARKRGEALRYIARWRNGEARAGLEFLSPDDPLLGGRGTDNRIAIWSDRYRDRPLVIQGPGAGAEVTAAALLDDALKIACA
ncbi:MAG: homoserine dehydrogenase [Lysobacter sp.]|nr:MAG: homoserine dehydrogenase [Lysobacter sp.]